MSDSSLSFVSTSSFRNSLTARNLAPYNIQGVYSPPVSNINYETVIGDLNVIDSPNYLIDNSPYPDQLYPLNEYGPDGGYSNVVINNKYPIKPNQGEYDPNDTQLDLINEFYIDAAYIENRYGPQGGFMSMVVIDNIQNNNKLYTPYWDPPTFIPSSYSPYQILLSNDPTGSDGLLSQDSFIAKLGAQTLKNLLQDRVDVENAQINGSAGNLDSFSSPFDASLLVSGRMDTTTKNYKITIPEAGLGTSQSLTTRISANYFPASPIPGDYFDESPINGGASLQITSALNAVNQLTGGALGGILNTIRNPSQIFLANTGSGQRSILFANLDYNRYQPGYDRNLGGILAVGQAALSLINASNGTLNGGFYVGSKNADPSTITSPPNQIPVDAFGRQVETPVYGPSELGILFEGNEGRINFGLAGKSYTDGGGIDGQFVWTSPKFKGNAGYKATPGGGAGSLDSEFNQISSQYTSNESTNLTFKSSSILDETQRLINSADNVAGVTRLKHVGNAINQVSKVFNDGYKELTKGSRVLSYVDNTTGGEAGIEYCRVFAKDTPYYTYNDLQKTDGITTSGRRFVNSVFDNTYNLNIAPLRNPGSTNIQPNEKGQLIAKKYMFSIENLAWRTSSRPGLTYDDLPACERGPNGGRVMWFPPYDLTFADTSSANFASTNFLGRPEPMYTYNNTTRTGSLSWKIIVDHPSVMNTIIEKQLKGQQRERIDSIIDSFFAGCVKYDIYELAKKFNTIPASDLYTYQEILNNPRLTREELEGVNQEIQKDNIAPSGSGGSGGNANLNNTNEKKYEDDPEQKNFQDRYQELAFYFHDDVPKPQAGTISNEPYQSTYTAYEALIPTYVSNAESLYGSASPFCKQSGTVKVSQNKNPQLTDTGKSYQQYCNEAKNVKQFFDTVVKTNYNLISSDPQNFVKDAYNIINRGGTITIEMVGSASALGNQDYNKELSLRRIDSVKQFFQTYSVGDANLKQALEQQKLIIKSVQGDGEDTSIPKAGGGDFGFEVNCRQDVRGGNNNITDNSNAQKFSVYAMACRRVKIKTITVKLPQVEVPNTNIQTNPDSTPKTVSQTNKIIPPSLQPNVSVTKKLKDGISKKILRNLFSECDYFEVIERENPMVYQTIKEKIKYFNPAFHSMTPEGLNARLTFLNQCVRPGETIPVIGADGRPKYNDAVNTSFGAPPILVLRIGDFYNTKIVPGSMSFTYENNLLDMNPEGIGIQPMIVKVSLTFSMIGGHGLAKPVDQLQNALSFNYYANTEIYDERATPTDDSYKKIDKELETAILAGQQPATINNVTTPATNNGGDTIGEIQTNIPIPNGQTGETSYQKVMDKLFDNTVTYFNTVVNQMEKLNLTYNYGIVQLVNDVRVYKTGTINQGGNPTKPEAIIWGQPSKDDSRLTNLFNEVLDQIDSNDNPILTKLIKTTTQSGYDANSTQIKELKLNLTNYIKSLTSTFSNGITTTYSDITNLEQGYVQLFRELNLIDTNTDGKILEGNVARVYNLTSTIDVSESSKTQTNTIVPTNTYQELDNDYGIVILALENYYKLLDENGIITSDLYKSGDFELADKNANFTPEDKLFFMLIARILDNKNKKQEFITLLSSGNLSTDNQFKRKLTNAVDSLADKYSKELREEEKLFTQFKKNKEFKSFVDNPIEKLYPKGKTRKFEYTTVPGTNDATQKSQVLALYTKKINGLEF